MKINLLPFTVILSLSFLSVCRAGELSGYKLLTSSFRTGDPEIFIVDPDTGDAVNLTHRPGSYERYPAWSRDGSRVTFISDRDGTFNIYIVDADGRNLR
jgi:Tol biopolymer transport system component